MSTPTRRAWHTRVRPRGQMTIPAEVRRELGLEPGDQMAWVIEDGSVRLKREDDPVARAYGAFRHLVKGPPLSAEELRAAAEQAIADQTVECMNGGHTND